MERYYYYKQPVSFIQRPHGGPHGRQVRLMKVTKARLPIYASLLAAAIMFATASGAEEQQSYSTLGQPETVSTVLSKENNIVYLSWPSISSRASTTPMSTSEKSLSSGKKLVVFVDPAHGQLDNGAWEGEMTGPSAPPDFRRNLFDNALARALPYALGQPFHRGQIDRGLHEGDEGKSDVYRNIPFVDTVRMATEAGAFIIVSEHLNNISSIVKASGLMNIPGVHIPPINGETGTSRTSGHPSRFSHAVQQVRCHRFFAPLRSQPEGNARGTGNAGQQLAVRGRSRRPFFVLRRLPSR